MITKKFFVVLGCFLFFATSNNAMAAVVYDDNTSRYFSTSEEDGTLCFGGTALTDDELKFRTYNQSNRYLENMIPTDINPDVNTVNNPVPDDIFIKSIYKQDEASHSYFYTPNNKYFMFSIDDSITDTGAINIDILDAKTGQTLSRGYNLTSGQYYKTTIDVQNRELVIIYSNGNSKLKTIPFFTFGSSNDVSAEFANVQNSFMMTRVSISSSSIPKNINGSQGKIISSYKTVGPIKGAANTTIYTKFKSSSDRMSSINLGWQTPEGIDCGYVLNLGVRSQFKSFTLGVGRTYDLRASTNSSSGRQATLEITEKAY